MTRMMPLQLMRASLGSGLLMVVQRCSPSERRAARGGQQKAPARGAFGAVASCCSAALDGHRLAVARALDRIAHLAVDEREQRVVAADADVRAGVELGAALAHDDRAGRNDLAAEHLDAEHLRLRIAAVTRRAAAFFLCHVSAPLDAAPSGRVDRADADLGEILAMPLALLVVLA